MNVTVVGGGMITHDQILPSLYQLQRLGQIGAITVCAQHGRTLRKLASSESICGAFPGHAFRAFPSFDADPDQSQPDLYREVIRSSPKRQLTVIALPDQMHFEAILAALEAEQHVLVVKPLVLRVAESEIIEREAFARGLLVAVDYHKRFDDRNLLARRKYRAGEFGEFRLGAAHLMEKWSYRDSNFQNWCTAEHTDAFTYIGCHYVDLVHFITGLLPVSVNVYGIRDRYPNGAEGYLWTDARVVWNNGACLSVQNSLSYPNDGPGSNAQGLSLYCAGGDSGAILRHSDQYRGLEYLCLGDSYSEPNPDYFQYVDLGGPGLTPVGYGFRSIEYIVKACLRVEASQDRQRELRAIDAEAILATTANSRYNERVIEAGRQSLQQGRTVDLPIGGSNPPYGPTQASAFL